MISRKNLVQSNILTVIESFEPETDAGFILQFPEQSVSGIPGIYPNTDGIYPKNNDYY